MPGLGFVGLPTTPIGGVSYSDEFSDASTLTDPWGETAGGSASTLASDINTTVAGSLYLHGQLYKVAPSPPFTVIAKVDNMDWDHTAGIIQIGGVWIVIAQAAPGPYIGFGVDVGVAGYMNLGSSSFDAAGAFVTNPHVVGTTAYDVETYLAPHLTKLVVASATSVSAYVSFDGGASWTTICTGYNPSVTPNYIGLESGGARSTWDWFHVT